MHMITEDEPSYHLRALYRRLSARPYRILYVGLDHALMKYLEESLDDCWIVRAPAGCVARPFIEQLNHSLFLFDEMLMDMAGRDLARFTRESAHREQTPLIIVKKPINLEWLASDITHLLSAML